MPPCEPDEGVDDPEPPLDREDAPPVDPLPVESLAAELDPVDEEPAPPAPDPEDEDAEEDADADVEDDVAEVELSSASRLASAWARVASASRSDACSAVGSMVARTSPALTR